MQRSELQGISPVFTHYLSSIPALHSVLVFVSIKSLPIGRVPAEERFLFKRVKSHELIFQCIVRYGYKDPIKDQKLFEEMLVNQLKEFIQDDVNGEEMERELALVDNALNDGVVYLMGEGEVMVSGSSFGKKLIVNYFYNWLDRSVRKPNEVYMIPRKQLLKVGMTYEI